MKKIPTVFRRDSATKLRYVLPEVHPDCQWVLDGEGVATVKWDGTACLVRDGRLYKRHEVKPGKQPPDDFEQVEHDPATSKTVGWIPVGDGPEDRWHREAFASEGLTDGTHELVGPKVNGNPDGFAEHVLIPHGWAPLMARQDVETAPRDFEGLRAWLLKRPYEGLVWHNPDGRMAKLKRRDFPAAGAR